MKKTGNGLLKKSDITGFNKILDKKMIKSMKDKKFNFICLFFAFIFLCLFAVPLNATIYYVDQNHPLANNSNLGTEGSPWADAHYGAQQLRAGDILYIKEGYYYRNSGDLYTPGILPNANGTAANPIIIKAYPGHTVTLASAPENNKSVYTNAAIGTGDRDTGFDYIIIDGFTINGIVYLINTNYSILRNCDITPATGHGDFPSVRIEKSSNITIRNNYIHDGLENGSDIINSPLIMEYDSYDCIIENNEFSNSVGAAIFLKDRPLNFTIRFNKFYNNSRYPDSCGVEIGVQFGRQNVYIYQNIFVNNSTGVRPLQFVDGIYIYNNTFYDNNYHIQYWYGNCTNINIHSNIFYNSPNTNRFFYSINDPDDISESNYNCFSNQGNWKVGYNIIATNLSDWKHYGNYNFDANSIAFDPLFESAQVEDFHLRVNSPCRGTGKNGVNMGAYISDTEIIGLISNPVGDTSAPFVSNILPISGATDIPINTNISFHIQDSGDGVNVNSIILTVNGQQIDNTNLQITGSSRDYEVIYNPQSDFNYNSTVTVTLNANDLHNPPNVMTQYTWSFTTESGMQTSIIFEDDFETGDFSKWIDVTNLTINSNTFNSHSGNYSAQLFYTEGGNAGWMWKKNISLSPTGETYIRWYQKWENGFIFNPQPDQKLLTIYGLNPPDEWGPTSDWRTYIHLIGTENGCQPNEIFLENLIWSGPGQWDGQWSAFPQNVGSPYLLRTGEWECIEAMIRPNNIGINNGAIRLWINGILKADYQNVEIRNNDTPLNAIQIEGWYSGGAPKNQYSWIDDIVIGTSYIGPDEDPNVSSSLQAPTLKILLPVSNLTARANGIGQITLSWKNPSDVDFLGTMVRYRTDGTYPINPNDATLVCNRMAAPGSNDSFNHIGLQNGITYYYSAFAYYIHNNRQVYAGGKHINATLP